MNRKALKKLSKNKEFTKLLSKQGIVKKKKNVFLILVLLALIGYFIFVKGNIFIIMGLTVLLILLMR